jgi:Flp pilus assembly CpaF family ATPase
MQGEGVNEALSTLTQNIHDAGTHNPQELIASAINYVVCTKRVGRKRFVSELVEVAGFDQENGEFTTGLIR